MTEGTAIGLSTREYRFTFGGTTGDWGTVAGGVTGEEAKLLVDILKLVDRTSSSWEGWPFAETCREGGAGDGDPGPTSPMW